MTTLSDRVESAVTKIEDSSDIAEKFSDVSRTVEFDTPKGPVKPLGQLQQEADAAIARIAHFTEETWIAGQTYTEKKIYFIHNGIAYNPVVIPYTAGLVDIQTDIDAGLFTVLQGLTADDVGQAAFKQVGNSGTDLPQASDTFITFDSLVPIGMGGQIHNAVQANLVIGQKIKTKGYYKSGDLGGGEYIVKARGAFVEDGGRYVYMSNGLMLDLVINECINARQFGAIGDDVSDDFIPIQTAVRAYNKVDLTVGNFLVSQPVRVPSNTEIFGQGLLSRISASDSMDGALDVLVNEHYLDQQLTYDHDIVIRDMVVFGNGFQRSKADGAVEWGRCIRLAAVHDVLIQRVHAIEGPQHCIDITNFNDDYIGKGHAAGPLLVGKSYDVVIKDSFVTDYCYDDGVTTHACHNILIDNVTARITDNAKTKTTYARTQNGIEIDDGSSHVIVSNSKVYGNNTLSKGFSLACHPNAPAVHDVIFENNYAQEVNQGITMYGDVNTDVVFDSVDWQSKNIKVKNFTLKKPFLRVDSDFLPSRSVDCQGYTDVEIDGVTVDIKGPDGTVGASTCVMYMSPTRRTTIKKVHIKNVPNAFVPGQIQGNSAWINLGSDCAEIEVDGVTVNNMGSMDRVVTDSLSNSLVVCKNITVENVVDGSTNKFAVVSAANAVFENIAVPSVGMMPYKIGQSFSQYPAGDYDVRHGKKKTIITGVDFEAENSGGVQEVPAMTFSRYFVSLNDPTGAEGKGTLCFKTSNSVYGSFSISALHEDTGEYRPLVVGYSSDVGSQWSPALDAGASLGSTVRRWSQVFSENGTINTSDARLKTPVVSLTCNELDAAITLSKEIGVWEWLNKSGARKHIGLTVQRAIEVMESFGLNPFIYGFICYDKWDNQYDYAELEVDEVASFNESWEEYENGKWRKLTKPAGDMYSFRPSELDKFIMAGLGARLERLEQAI